jgi:3-(3-hydroxy-phenyl)propionate hydroxylase
MYFDFPRYPFQPPSELHGERPLHPVAIVGAGPVGLALALGLTRHGIPVVLLERRDTVSEGSRAICISRRSIEILEWLGVGQPLLAKGVAWTGGRSFYRDKVVLEFTMPHEPGQPHPPMINLPQCFAEYYLVKAILGEPLADLRWQSAVTAIQPGDGTVTLTVDTPDGPYPLQASWVVACDGARSSIREAFGLKLKGTGYEGRYVIADIRLSSDSPAERRVWFDPPWNPGSTIIMHRQPDNIWRIDYQLRSDEDPDQEVKLERAIPRIQAHLSWIGETGDWTVEWISLYKVHSLTLDTYWHDRILFAGDAAHLVPIFGVRGLNSGIEDAYNLAWKLAYVVRGLSDKQILDSYSLERVHAARENMREAEKSTLFMTPPTRGYQILRDAILSLAVSQPFVRELVNPRQTTPISLRESPLNTPEEGHVATAPGLHPGSPVINGSVSVPIPGRPDSADLFSFFGRDFTGLVFAEAAHPLPLPISEWRSLESGAAPFKLLIVADSPEISDGSSTVVDSMHHLFDHYGASHGSFYLIRPDGHVAARWQHPHTNQIMAAIVRAACQKRQPEVPV